MHNFSATTHARLKAASGCDEKTPKNDFRTARLEPRMDTYLSTSWISPFFDYRTAVASTRKAGEFGSSTSATSDAEEERIGNGVDTVVDCLVCTGQRSRLHIRVQ